MTGYKHWIYRDELAPGNVITAAYLRNMPNWLKAEIDWICVNGAQVALDKFLKECLPEDEYEDSKELFAVLKPWNAPGLELKYLGRRGKRFIDIKIYLKAEEEVK